MKSGIEWQVSNKELSKRLKELGVKQESEFVWLQVFNPAGWILCESNRPCVNLEEDFRAYTVAELGEMLPCFAVSERYFSAKDNQQEWNCYSDNTDDDGVWGYEERTIATTEADARAKMLIHLIEKGIVRP